MVHMNLGQPIRYKKLSGILVSLQDWHNFAVKEANIQILRNLWVMLLGLESMEGSVIQVTGRMHFKDVLKTGTKLGVR